ncbi:hypothetical protein [Sulfobacillus thermosulfidooxidans]|uniref:hypothetical protein n=1 Tax=Sulfobacillus thermosulfidooxidans TaxID=28034 RepID=UPI00042461C5|nr:hypothetical protein [Sulfobacillus thermosulfidooxidans]
MIQYLVSCRIKEGYYDEAIEFIHTLQAYYPGSTLYADEFGPVNLIYLMIPFESLASYEDRVDCLRNDVRFMHLIREGTMWFERKTFRIRILRAL